MFVRNLIGLLAAKWQAFAAAAFPSIASCLSYAYLCCSPRPHPHTHARAHTHTRTHTIYWDKRLG